MYSGFPLKLLQPEALMYLMLLCTCFLPPDRQCIALGLFSLHCGLGRVSAINRVCLVMSMFSPPPPPASSPESTDRTKQWEWQFSLFPAPQIILD